MKITLKDIEKMGRSEREALAAMYSEKAADIEAIKDLKTDKGSFKLSPKERAGLMSSMYEAREAAMMLLGATASDVGQLREENMALRNALDQALRERAEFAQRCDGLERTIRALGVS